jgi:uncharacterized protein YkwD
VTLLTIRLWHSLILLGAVSSSLSHADALSAVQTLRIGGCGGSQPAAQPLRHDAILDRAAQQWADGRTPATAVAGSGYSADAIAAVRVRGPESSALESLRRSSCRSVGDGKLRDVGTFRRGSDTWLILASAYAVPGRSRTAALSSRTLELINAARARGARCGERSFGPAPPVRLSDTLATVALGHATDMAEHNYFEHEDLAGHSPAQRVRAVGYQEKLVGENIAYGPQTADEVVQGWLDSPGHCENIMDPRFAEMGIAYAPGQLSRHGLYWVQLLAAPRA